MSFDLSTWLAANIPTPSAGGTVALTTVERAAAYLAPEQGSLAPQNNETLRRLILAVSAMAMGYMNRDTLARTLRTETYPSSRLGRIVLRHWPALTLGSVNIGGSTSPALGLSLETFRTGAQRIVADEGTFWAGSRGLSVVYQTGFVRAETVTVPESPFQVTPESVALVVEGAVDVLTGAAVAATLRDDGDIVLDASSTGRSVVLVYSYVPADIEQVVIDEVALAQKARGRLGEVSKALPNGGGTATFASRRLTDISQMVLNSYRRVVPS